MEKSIREGITFNDVLLVPKFGVLTSRRDAKVRTRLTRNIYINTPIISANMDTVTETEMAIALAMAGGIGILHRYCSISEQVEMVRKVKRFVNIKIERPYTTSETTTFGELLAFMKQKKVHSILVTDEAGHLKGIVTSRDIRFQPNEAKLVREIMTPREKLVVGNTNITRQEALILMETHKVEKIPIVDEQNLITGLITAKDLVYHTYKKDISSLDKNGCLLVGGSIGVKDDYIERAQALIDAGVDVLCIDVAHGHSRVCGDATKVIKAKFPDIDLIVGNVATAEGTKYLCECGADAIKVGIGNGSICITRDVTGCGVPQLSALWDCAPMAKSFGVPVISDGGNGGKIGSMVKALAAGANSLMLGNFLAGTDEAPGSILVKDGKKVKIIRGMAGYGANMSKRQREGGSDDVSDMVPEGVEAHVPYKGKVQDIIYQILGGIRSGMSYCGVSSLEDLPRNAEFIRISSSASRESTVHSVNIL